MNLGNPPDADQRAAFKAALEAERFGKAFSACQLGILRRALALLGPDRDIHWNKEPASTEEFAGGLAVALDQLVEREGDEASYRLIVARDVVATVASMQILLRRKHADDRDPMDILAELLLQAIQLGNVEVMLGQTEGGFLDEYADLKWREKLDLDRRRKAAASTKDVKERKRGTVLREAQKIVQVNPTLSNDDLAFRLKTTNELNEAIRTITGWIRGWRREGTLPPRR